jgi:prefoldin subunit 5
MIWSIALIVALGLGIYAGAKVTAANKDTEIMDIQAALEAAQASLAEANVELAFWQTTIKGLAEGKQLAGAELNGRPSLGD